MRKYIPVTGIFILFLLVFIWVAYTRKSDHEPSDIAINDAIAWAQSLVGQPAFPVTGTNGSIWSTYRCTDFVANAYGYPSIPYNAILFWNVSVDQHRGDWNAPRGSLVFFSASSANDKRGHVALSTGNGNLIEAGNELITRNTISGENHSAAYLGWAWPPSTWPGRSDVLKATALTWGMQTGKAIILTIVSWLIYLIIKSKITKMTRYPEGRGIRIKRTVHNNLDFYKEYRSRPQRTLNIACKWDKKKGCLLFGQPFKLRYLHNFSTRCSRRCNTCGSPLH